LKRLARILFLVIAGSCAVWAQENAAAKTESSEPSAAWKWANFLILAAGLGYLIGKHAPGLFRARTAEIQKDIAEAQAVRKDAESRAAAVDERLRALGSEMEQLRAQSKIEMQREGERIREETARAIAHRQEQAAQEIESAGTLARRELKEYAARLALEVAEQRIRARADASTESALVDGFVADLGRQEAKN
jgi:F-type H+-transporting ATPase subunit b